MPQPKPTTDAAEMDRLRAFAKAVRLAVCGDPTSPYSAGSSPESILMNVKNALARLEAELPASEFQL